MATQKIRHKIARAGRGTNHTKINAVSVNLNVINSIGGKCSIATLAKRKPPPQITGTETAKNMSTGFTSWRTSDGAGRGRSRLARVGSYLPSIIPMFATIVAHQALTLMSHYVRM